MTGVLLYSACFVLNGGGKTAAQELGASVRSAMGRGKHGEKGRGGGGWADEVMLVVMDDLNA
jgi:hypothetical protein